MSMLPSNGFGLTSYSASKRKGTEQEQPVPKLPKNASTVSLFHGGGGSGDGRDAMEVDIEVGKQALPLPLPLAQECVWGVHDFPCMALRIRDFSSHPLHDNLRMTGAISFAKWLFNNQSILHGQRILELGSGTGVLSIFLRKAFGADITTCDCDDEEIAENTAYNCVINNLAVLPHIRHTWGGPFPTSIPDWSIVIASDIIQNDEQCPYMINTLSFLLKEYMQTSQRAACTTITDKSGTRVHFKYPAFLISLLVTSDKYKSVFFEECGKAALEVQHLDSHVYLINKKN